MATLCDKCGTKTILMTGNVYADPDPEPYESGVEEKIEPEVVAEFGVHFQYCPVCKEPDMFSMSNI